MTLADLRALVERMTPGPWRTRLALPGRRVDVWQYSKGGQPVEILAHRACERDGSGMVTLRTLAPALLDVAEAGDRYRALWLIVHESNPRPPENDELVKIGYVRGEFFSALAALDRAMASLALTGNDKDAP